MTETNWKVGDRVTWDEDMNDRRNDGPRGVLSGVIVEMSDVARVKRDDGHKNAFGYWCVSPLSILRPLSPPVADADKPRVGECWETNLGDASAAIIKCDQGDGEYETDRGLFGFASPARTSFIATYLLTRRKSLASAPVAETEFYGTCPPVDELPDVLPGGAKSRLGAGTDLKGWVLNRQHHSGPSYIPSPNPFGTFANAQTNVTWQTVPRQPKNASGPAGSVDAAHRETAGTGAAQATPGLRAPTQPSEPARPKLDPYRTGPKAFPPTQQDMEERVAWEQKQDAIHARKVAQHLADFDRPIRTGALLNRDRWGQKVSLHTWDSEDVE